MKGDKNGLWFNYYRYTSLSPNVSGRSHYTFVRRMGRPTRILLDRGGVLGWSRVLSRVRGLDNERDKGKEENWNYNTRIFVLRSLKGNKV